MSWIGRGGEGKWEEKGRMMVMVHSVWVVYGFLQDGWTAAAAAAAALRG